MEITVKELIEDGYSNSLPVCITGYSCRLYAGYLPSYKITMDHEEVSAESIVGVVNFYLDKKLKEIGEVGEIVLTSTEDGELVAVTRQDEDGRILKVIWSKK